MSPELTRNGPVEAIYSVTTKGWSNKNCFLQWLKHFKLHTNSSLTNPVLLVLDNHYSHISLPIYNYWKDTGIVMCQYRPIDSSHSMFHLLGLSNVLSRRNMSYFWKVANKKKILFWILLKYSIKPMWKLQLWKRL